MYFTYNKLFLIMGKLFVISAPSGTGKTSLIQAVLEDPVASNTYLGISCTTRKARPKEEDGVSYFFISQMSFMEKVKNNDFLEYAEVFGNLYGSLLSPVLSSIDNGNDVLFDVDWQGSQQIKNSSLGKYVLSIFILPPSIDELESRLKLRNQDSDEVISNRMAKSVEEISHWPEYDYVVVNDDINITEKN